MNFPISVVSMISTKCLTAKITLCLFCSKRVVAIWGKAESLLLERVPVLLFVASAFQLNLSDEISGSDGVECNVMIGNTVQLNNLENTFYCPYQQMRNRYTGGTPYPRIQYPQFTAVRKKKFGKLKK